MMMMMMKLIYKTIPDWKILLIHIQFTFASYRNSNKSMNGSPLTVGTIKEIYMDESAFLYVGSCSIRETTYFKTFYINIPSIGYDDLLADFAFLIRFRHQV